MIVLLDSTVIIDYLRGRPAVARVNGLRDRGDVPCTTAVNVEEVIRGLRPSEADAARQLFDGLRIVQLGRSEGLEGGTITAVAETGKVDAARGGVVVDGAGRTLLGYLAEPAEY